MSTGPEHYAKAEELLDKAHNSAAPSTVRQEHRQDALVHATLALAAAQTNADTIMLCDHGAFPCSRCLNTQIADHLFALGWSPS